MLEEIKDLKDKSDAADKAAAEAKQNLKDSRIRAASILGISAGPYCYKCARNMGGSGFEDLSDFIADNKHRFIILGLAGIGALALIIGFLRCVCHT